MEKKADKIVVTAAAKRTIKAVASAFTDGEIAMVDALNKAQSSAQRGADKLLAAGMTVNMMLIDKKAQRETEIEFGGSVLTVLHIRHLIDVAMVDGLCKAGGIFGDAHHKAFNKPTKERTVQEAKDAKAVQQRLGVLRARLKQAMGATATKTSEPKQPVSPTEKLLKQIGAVIKSMQKLETPEFDVTEACKYAIKAGLTIDPTFTLNDK